MSSRVPATVTDHDQGRSIHSSQSWPVGAREGIAGMQKRGSADLEGGELLLKGVATAPVTGQLYEKQTKRDMGGMPNEAHAGGTAKIAIQGQT